jgi:hypothetical protein
MIEAQHALIETQSDCNFVFFDLHRKDDEVWLQHPQFGPLKLGAFDPVCDKLCDFLEREDLGH